MRVFGHLFMGIAWVLLFALTINPAWSRVDVVPKRLIFEPGTRTAMVTLINRTNESYTYRMGWQDIVYTPDGIKRVDEEAERITPASSDFIRFAPRQVVLRPGESQSIRVLVRRPPDLAPGEYRSHFLFQRQGGVQESITQTTNNEGVSIDIRIIHGISIPIIVRHGSGEPEVSITEAAIQPRPQNPEQQQLRLGLSRTGPFSSYADIKLWQDNPSGQPKLLAQRNEFALHADANSYTLNLPLKQPPANTGSLRLEVSYTQRAGDPVQLEKSLTP